MKLPSRYLPGAMRKPIRFMVVGTVGMLAQTWFFMATLLAFHYPDKGSILYFTAFILGYLLEAVPNYLLSNWYTFGTRPNLKNAGGFVLARVINFPLQIGLLPIMLELLPTWRDDYISFLVIFIAGIANYLICLLFFKKKEKE